MAGKLNDKANYKGCFECHKPHAKRDFVMSYSQAAGMMAAATPYGAAADVTIANFAFGPTKVTVAPGKPVTWVNTDGSPHQVTITSGAPGRSEMLLKGQSHTQSFATAGIYDYMCGLHPSMKGQIDVK